MTLVGARGIYVTTVVVSVLALGWSGTAHCQTAGVGAPAWGNGRLHINRAAVLGGSDVVLQRPNLLPEQAMPLGNGRLGVAAWSADGLTVQLNRADTMPRRLSPGQVVVPGLERITSAKDYKGRVDLWNGQFTESGDGMSATVYVEAATDTLVIDVTGADPHTRQTAELKLWPPRAPKASVEGAVGELADSWKDSGEPGASGLPFGSLAAITGTGRNVRASVSDTRTVALTLMPDARGRFTLRIASPAYDGTRRAGAALAGELAAQPAQAHRDWWHRYWRRADLITARSSDGEAQYMANLRNLYLFYAVADKGTAWPGSQAGIADMLSSEGDEHMWDPAAFWQWNLRMQVAANLTAGLPELNAPYFHLYRSALPGIRTWTKQHMAGRAGACVPETMRFNGPGIEYEAGANWGKKPVIGLNCAADFEPYYNARTISTGAEVSFWIWQTYLQTDDRTFLKENYPVMRAAAEFLLAYQKPGKDGLLHTSPSNAHETQWDVTDPVTDLAGLRTLYADTAAAAHLLGVDAPLAQQTAAALAKLPPLPRTQASKPESVLPPASDAAAGDVLATSYEPAAPQHNVENLGLEPVWPYGLIGEDSALGVRTFHDRPYPINQDWSFDPIQAARLGLGAEVGSTLKALTERYQVFPSGLASWGGATKEFYIEQIGVVSDALSEALAQDYQGERGDSVIRIAAAVPPGWSMAGTVAVRRRTTVDVQVQDGVVTAAVIVSGADQSLHVMNPWAADESVTATVADCASRKPVRRAQSGNVLAFTAFAGHAYCLARGGSPGKPFAPLRAERAAVPRHLGTRTIGLEAGR
jgi:alpha-L-fucosidase 2